MHRHPAGFFVSGHLKSSGAARAAPRKRADTSMKIDFTKLTG
jgi:hypothetical protein